MSKVLIQVDTEANTISADIDGVKIKNLEHVSVSKFKDCEDKEGIDVHMVTIKEMVGDLKSRTILTAHSKEGLVIANKQKVEYLGKSKDLIVYENHQTMSNAIANLLGHNENDT